VKAIPRKYAGRILIRIVKQAATNVLNQDPKLRILKACSNRVWQRSTQQLMGDRQTDGHDSSAAQARGLRVELMPANIGVRSE
jgi:hypothetical protein